MEFLLGLVAALLFALGTVLQQKAGLEAPALVEGSRAGLLLRIAREPLWLAGIGIEIMGFAAQAVALTVGDLAVVQPLLVSTVVFALPIGAQLTGQRLRAGDLLAAILVAGSLAVFLIVADPQGGRDMAGSGEWLVAVGAIAGAAALVTVLARRRGSAGRKAALLGTATGLLYGLTAALTKAVGDHVDHEGLVSLFVHWEVYGLVAVGYASMTLNQLALQTGALAPAVATSLSLDPIVSVVLGLTLFRETLRASTAGAVGGLAALGAALAGIVYLARSQHHEPTPKAPKPSGVTVTDSS